MGKLHFRDRSFAIETYRQQITEYKKRFDFDTYLQSDEAGKRKYLQDAKKCLGSLATVREELTLLVSTKRKQTKKDPLNAVKEEAHLEAVRVIIDNLKTTLEMARKKRATETKTGEFQKLRKR